MSPVIIFRHEEAKAAAIRRIQAIKPDQENPLAMFVGPYKKIRSLEANAAYWRLVGLVADATGHDRETLHQYFKRKAFGVRIEEIGGALLEVVPSSAQVSRGDFSQLISYVQEFIDEHGISESA